MTSVLFGMLASVGLVVIDPGHFHAALTQKRMNPQLSADVRVFAPQGRELDDHLKLIASFNGRADNPTVWRENVCACPDYLKRFRAAAAAGELEEDSIVVLAGRNDRKGLYARTAVESGCHVLADKPMAITPAVFAETRKAALLAKERGLAFADLMTDRFSFRSRLQAELAQCRAFYGEQEKGTPEDPAVVKESVHHFHKLVNGQPLRRPEWYYDTTKQGEGIVDVATHMVDSVQRSLFPGQRLSCDDVSVLAAREWPTRISPEQFRRSTGGEADAPFDCLCNGEFTYALRGVCCRISVVWNYEASEGTGDTGYSLMRGTKAEVFIRQGPAEGYRSVLYARSRRADDAGFEASLRAALAQLSAKTPGLGCEKADEPGLWRITYPGKYAITHEEQFSLVLADFLKQVKSGKPDTDGIDNLIVKYHTLVEAWKRAHGQVRIVGDDLYDVKACPIRNLDAWRRAVDAESGLVICATPVPRGLSRESEAWRAARAVGEEVFKLADNKRILYLDVRPSFYGKDGIRPEFYEADGLTLNAAGRARLEKLYQPLRDWAASGSTNPPPATKYGYQEHTRSRIHFRRSAKEGGKRWWWDRVMEKMDQRDRICRENGGELDVLFIGDSRTHRWEWADSGAPVYEKLCKGRRVMNMAIGGDGRGSQRWLMDNGLIDGLRPKVVSLGVGGNDHVNQWRDDSPQAKARDLGKMIDILRSRMPEAKILLLPIVNRLTDKPEHLVWMKEDEVTNPLLEKLCDGERVVWLDIGGPMRDAIGHEAEMAPKLTTDGTHYSTFMYEYWYDLMLPYLPVP